MAVSPRALVQLKGRKDIFLEDHPKFTAFFKQNWKSFIREGTLIDIKFTLPDGTVKETNMRVNKDDVESARMFMKKKD